MESEKIHVYRYPGVLVRAIYYKFLTFHYLYPSTSVSFFRKVVYNPLERTALYRNH